MFASSSLAGVSPVRVAQESGGPVADWQFGLETGRVEAPYWGLQLCGPPHEAKPAASLGHLPPIGCDQELAEFGHPTLMRRVRSPRIRSENDHAGQQPTVAKL